jgi:DNA repair photolyase
MRAEYVEQPCRSALNRVHGMPFRWSLNPYMGCAHRCTFCYVRGFELRAGRPSDERYGAAVRVKINVVDVLRRELARRSWRREQVVVGAATDPYQPAEGRYCLTRGCIDAFAEADTPFSIITRGPLVVRDIDVLSAAAARAEVTVNVSIPTLDEEIWRRTEPGTAPPRQRLRTIGMLVDAGIRAGIAVAPILPRLSDRPDLLAEVVRAGREAGATHLWSTVLNLRPGTREHFLSELGRFWPDELERYERLYAGRAYLPDAIVRPIQRQVADLARRYDIGDRRPRPIEPPPAAEQLPLLVPPGAVTVAERAAR